MMATESCIGQCGNDREGGEAFERSDSKAAGASKVVAVGVGGALDQAQHTQPTQLARQPGGREIGQQLYEVAARQSVDVEFGTLDCTPRSHVPALEHRRARPAPWPPRLPCECGPWRCARSSRHA